MKFFSSIITSSWGDALVTVFLTLLLIASLIGAVWFFSANVGKARENCLYVRGISTKSFIWIIIGVGFIVRLALALLITGYRGALGTINFELKGYYEYFQALDIILDNGAGSLYSFAMNIHPLSAYVMTVFAFIAKLFGVFNVNSLVLQLFIKLPLILCDVASAYLLYRLARKYVNDYTGIIAAALFMLCPVFMLGSAISVTVYPMLILGFLVVFYFLLAKKYGAVIISYSLTLLISPDAVFMLPVIAAFIVYNYVKTIIRFKREGEESDKKTLISVPCFLLIGLTLIYLLSLPFFITDFGVNPIKIFNMLFIRPFVRAVYFVFNSLSVYNIFGKNGDRLNLSFPIEIFVTAFFVIALIITVLVYMSKRNRATLTLLAAYVGVTLSCYMIGTSELTAVPALALLIMSFVVIRDKRIINVLALMSLFVFINYMAVMIQAGFLSNAASTAFYSVAYDGSAVLLSSTTMGTAVSIIASIGAVLTHVYFTFVLLDVAVTDKRKPPVYTESLGQALKSWFLSK